MPRPRHALAALVAACALCAPALGAGAPGGPAASVGDSYSSGEGSGAYDPGTNVPRDRCHRSVLAWPRLLGVPAERHLACSGATILNLAQGRTALAPDDRGQATRLAELPEAPATVFVTLGGNDAGFADILTRCVLTSCVGTVATRSAQLPALGARLAAAYGTIAAAARGGRVVVVGYPQIIPSRPPSGLRCAWLGDAEVPAVLGFQAALDTTIGGAAAQAGVEFVPLGDAFDGHELCTPTSWMFPVLLNPFSTNQQQAHPRAAGQAAIAARVRAYVETHPAAP